MEIAHLTKESTTDNRSGFVRGVIGSYISMTPLLFLRDKIMKGKSQELDQVLFEFIFSNLWFVMSSFVGPMDPVSAEYGASSNEYQIHVRENLFGIGLRLDFHLELSSNSPQTDLDMRI